MQQRTVVDISQVTANIVAPSGAPSGDIAKRQVLYVLLGELNDDNDWDMAIASEIGNMYGNGSEWRAGNECWANNCWTVYVFPHTEST